MNLYFNAFLSIIFYLFLHSVTSFTINGNEYRDLEWNDNFFEDETRLWTTNISPSISLSTQCERISILGGYGVFDDGKWFKRNFTNLPTHDFIYVTFELWRFDTLNFGDYIYIDINGTTFKIGDWNYASYSGIIDHCFWYYPDMLQLQLYVKMNHTGNSFYIKFQNYNDQNSRNEGWGIRKLTLTLKNNTNSEKTALYSLGNPLPPTSTRLVQPCDYNQFWNGTSCKNYINIPCATNQYWDGTNCINCSSPCQMCFGPSDQECYTCTDNHYYSLNTCNNLCHSSCRTCTGPNENQCTTCTSQFYLYPDGICRSNCSFPNIAYGGPPYECRCQTWQRMYSDLICRNCSFPFTISGYRCIDPCNSSQFFYYNGSCLANCPYPFVNSSLYTLKVCKFPCTNGFFYYSNGSCLRQCSFPFVRRNISIGIFCDFPCLTDEFYYLNGTCKKTCPLPFIKYNISVSSLCDFPCTVDQFFYQNNSCHLHCNPPFNSINVGVGFLCNFPCLIQEFYFRNKTCQKNCTFPYISENSSIGSYCNFPCAKNTYLNSNFTCQQDCNPPFQIYNISGDAFCLDENSLIGSRMIEVLQAFLTMTVTASGSVLMVGGDPYTTLIFVSVLQMFFYLLFYNVNYPSTIRNLLGIFGMAKFNFLPNPLSVVIDKMPDLSSPKNFYDNNYTGFFFNSCGPTFCVLLIVFLSYLSSLVLAKYLRLSRFTRLAHYIYRYFDRSFFLRVVIACYMELLITSLLQVMKMNFNSGLLVVSSFFGLLVFFFCYGFPFYILKLLLDKSVNNSKLQKYEPIIEDYDISHKEKRIFGFYMISKRTIHCSSLVLLYYVPIAQTLIPWIANGTMIYLLIKMKPHNRAILNFFDTFFELGYFGLHSAVFGLALLDKINIQDGYKRDFLGVIIMITIILILIGNIIFIWLENIFTIKNLIKKLKVILSNSKKIKVLQVKQEKVLKAIPGRSIKRIPKKQPVQH